MEENWWIKKYLDHKVENAWKSVRHSQEGFVINSLGIVMLHGLSVSGFISLKTSTTFCLFNTHTHTHTHTYTHTPLKTSSEQSCPITFFSPCLRHGFNYVYTSPQSYFRQSQMSYCDWHKLGAESKRNRRQWYLLHSLGKLFPLEGHSLLAWRVSLSKCIISIDNGCQGWAEISWTQAPDNTVGRWKCSKIDLCW